MDEATAANRPRRSPFFSYFRKLRRSQRGQALVEYLLIMFLALGFTRFIFFNKEFGFKAMLDKTMLRIGSYLEQNLKSGTKQGGDGVKSLDAFAGTDRWSN